MSFTEEDYREILAEFERLSDVKYKAFNESLMPGIKTAYGVRVPAVRALAKDVIRKDAPAFLQISRPDSYEETMLRGFVIAGMKTDMDTRLALLEGFLPLIDNWAVCDTFCGTFRLKTPAEREAMWGFLRPLFHDSREFYARFALVMLLSHYVTRDYIEQALQVLGGECSGAYYVQMAKAWAISVCYVKFPEETLPLLQAKTLPPFVQNKSIQKIRESYRVEKEDKELLLSYKV